MAKAARPGEPGAFLLFVDEVPDARFAYLFSPASSGFLFGGYLVNEDGTIAFSQCGIESVSLLNITQAEAEICTSYIISTAVSNGVPNEGCPPLA